MKKYNDIAQELKQWVILNLHIMEHKVVFSYKLYSLLMSLKKSIGKYREQVPEVSNWLSYDLPMAISKCRTIVITPVNIFNNHKLCKACLNACAIEDDIFKIIERGKDAQDSVISYLDGVIKHLDNNSAYLEDSKINKE